MTFVTTWLAIAGAAAVSIPIIIHLLSRQRRRPIEWAAMRFLLEAMRKHKRRLQVQQLLLLATRCLIVLLLGAALARPILIQAGLLARGGNRAVYLVIDDGMASGVMTGDQTALETQLEQARRIIGALDAGDRVGVVAAARPARALLAPPSSDHASALALLQSLEPSDSPTDLAGAMLALRGALDAAADDDDHSFVYLLSEFREGSAPVDSPLPAALRDLVPRLTLLAAAPAPARVGNVQITSIDPVRNVIVPGAADGSGQITVRLARHGDELAADVSRVRLSIESPGTQRPGTAVPGLSAAAIEPRTVRWEPGQSQASVDFLLNLSGQNDREIALTARIEGDALDADNARHAVLDLRRQLRIVMLERRAFGFEASIDRYRAGQWIRRALEPYDRAERAGPMQVLDAEPAALSVSDVRAADVVVASRPDLIGEGGWDVLRDFVDAGGLLIVTPPSELNVHQWVDRFTAQLDLPWRIGLEAVEYPEGAFMADEQPASEVLRLISTDLDELARPVVTSRALPVDIGEGETAVVLRLADGAPMLLTAAPTAMRTATGDDLRGMDTDVAASRGMVAFFTVAPELDWTSLPSKPLMVPLMQELVRQGLSMIHQSHRAVAGDVPSLIAHRSAVEVIDPAGERLALDASHRPHRPLTRAGVHEVRDAASNRLGAFAVNVDPAAGRTETQTAEAVQAWLAAAAAPGAWATFAASDPAAAFRAAGESSPLAAILLLIVLALVLIETLLARWFSHSSEAETSERAFARGTLSGGTFNVQTSNPRARSNVQIEPVHATLP